MINRITLAGLALALGLAAALAQNSYPTTGGAQAPASVVLCINASVAVPCTSSVPLSVTVNSGSLTSQGYSAAVSITRPANATPYTANDVVRDVTNQLQFPSMGPSGGEIVITSTELEIDVAAVPSGMTSFRLYLYSVTPPSALADNAAFDLPSGDRASFLGYVDLGTPVDLGSTLYARTDAINAQFKLAGTSLFGYLVTNGGFTPAGNSEVYKITLHAAAL